MQPAERPLELREREDLVTAGYLLDAERTLLAASANGSTAADAALEPVRRNLVDVYQRQQRPEREAHYRSQLTPE